MKEWICEEHPMEEMGHDGCLGAGVLKEAQMFHVMLQRRNALQELRECKSLYESMIQGLYNRVLQLEESLKLKGENKMRKKDELVEGAQGCLGKAKDDEMLFIFRAQDATAPLAILEWMKINFHSLPESKLREAFECIIEMRKHENKKIRIDEPTSTT